MLGLITDEICMSQSITDKNQLLGSITSKTCMLELITGESHMLAVMTATTALKVSVFKVILALISPHSN